MDNPNSILFVANVGEEGEGNLSGMRYLCRQSSLASKIRAFIVLDGPTTDHITCQALASRRFEITFSGPGGHSWSDFGIGNPVHALAARFRCSSTIRSRAPLRRESSFNFGTIEGGSSINSIPTEARSKVDIRSENAARIDEMVELLTNCIDRSLQAENDRATGGRVSARFKEVGSRPGGRLPDGANILRCYSSGGRSSGSQIASGLRLHGREYSVVSWPAGNLDRSRRTRRRRAYAERMVSPDGRETGLKRILLTLFSLLAEQ